MGAFNSSVIPAAGSVAPAASSVITRWPESTVRRTDPRRGQFTGRFSRTR